MSKYPDNSCGCMEGEILVFYKNESNKTVREDWTYCAVCNPDSSSSSSAKDGEVEIRINEFITLKNSGWRDVQS